MTLIIVLIALAAGVLVFFNQKKKARYGDMISPLLKAAAVAVIVFLVTPLVFDQLQLLMDPPLTEEELADVEEVQNEQG